MPPQVATIQSRLAYLKILYFTAECCSLKDALLFYEKVKREREREGKEKKEER